MIRRPARLFACLPLFALVAACGSTASDPTPTPAGPAPTAAPTTAPTTPPGTTTPKPDNGAPSTNYPAPHPALPQLVNQANGKVLATPKLYLVVYPGYAHTANLQTFAQALGKTPYWTATTQEYGVGAIDYAGMKELTETAPAKITDTEVASFIGSKITSGELGTPDTSTIYAIFYPETTTISSSSGGIGGGTSCSSFGGYHSDTTLTVDGKAANYAFAVLPTCASFGNLTGIDGLTGAASHELIEAVTDPFPSTRMGADSAFATVDSDHFIWNIFGGTEAGDLCAQEADAFAKLSGFDFTVQRTWSNKAAKAGHNPCVPAAASAYFQSGPVQNDDVMFTLPPNFGGGDVATKGVTIPVGKSKAIEVDLFSDGPTSGPWTVSAEDTLAKFGAGATLDFAWDRTTGVNGEKLHLTVTVKSASTAVPGAHPFTIVSTLGSKRAIWPGLVVEK